jgi:uncharacterized protein (DUF2236 family)
MASGSIIEDQGLFGPESAIWRVNRESVVTLGGTCALLMQLAHPRVAAGVRDHSRFEEDTVGRLRRTLDLTMTVVFGSRTAAMQAVRLINTRHRSVTGPGYSAMDPELLMWVHATLVYSGLHAYRAFVGPLSAADRNGYYQDTKEIGILLGIPRQLYPASIEAFDAYLEGLIDGDEITVGEDAREMGWQLLRPRIRMVPRVAFAPMQVITAGLLPPKLRAAYGLEWGRAQRVAFPAFRAGLAGLVALAPAPIRWLPYARHAYRRLKLQPA